MTHPRRNIKRKRKANKRMRVYRAVRGLIYRWDDLVIVSVEPDTTYMEEGFGPTITVPFKLVE